jgi:DNA-binding NarL/FixJ family response regulator
MLRAIIIDDEANAREKLAFMLGKYCSASVALIAQAKNAEEGVNAIMEHRPDLVFLDVEMPGETGSIYCAASGERTSKWSSPPRTITTPSKRSSSRRSITC